jgi:subtilisin-like proprotein convertase family protein
MQSFYSPLCRLIISTFLPFTLAWAQPTNTAHYYYFDQRIELPISERWLSVKFSGALPHDKMDAQLLATLGGRLAKFEALDFDDYHLIELQPGETAGRAATDLQGSSGVDFVAPVLMAGRVRQMVTAELVVRFRPEAASAERARLIEQHGVRVLRELSEDTFLLTTESAKGKATRTGLEMANLFHASGMVIFAQPNFIYPLGDLLQSIPNDPFFSQQWPLLNSGQAVDVDDQNGDGIPERVQGFVDADMDVDLAWDITTGNDSIRIAMLDIGIDLDHPDLQANLLPGFDFAENDTIPNDDDAGFLFNGHGTATAGIVAAVGNNNRGIAGVAYGCKLIPIRIFDDRGSTSDAIIASGFQAAVARGAAVINNSWGGNAPSALMTTAIQNARRDGRGGLGCVIFFAAGNGGFGSVLYPANLTEVIAVSASNMFNEKKSAGSRDGQYEWGGNYGDSLDVVAPAINFTTDIVGNGGQDPRDYVPNFNGTSASCAHASGVAALILSVNPSLTASQVQAILEQSCDKIGEYPYDQVRRRSAWNSRLGFGRLNAHAAVGMARNEDFTPPQIRLVPLQAMPAHNDVTITARISDATGVQTTGAAQPLLYFRVDSGQGFAPWDSVADLDGPAADLFEFIMPGQPANTQVEYYLAAQDLSPAKNPGTFPFGGSGIDPPGSTPPRDVLTFRVGELTTDRSRFSTDVPQTISEQGATLLMSKLEVLTTYKVVDVDVTIDLSHTFNSDLIIMLESPQGSRVVLSSRNGFQSDNFINTTFDDEAEKPLSSGTAPFTGRFQPDDALAELDGELATGEWKLWVYDAFDQDGGTLNSWSLTFTRTIGPEPAATILPDRFKFDVAENAIAVDEVQIANHGAAPLNFRIAVAGGGGEMESFGEAFSFNVRERQGRGNVFRADQSTTLAELSFYLLPRGADSLHFFVYEGNTAAGEYRRLFSNRVQVTTTAAGFYSSGPIAVRLRSGKFYFTGVAWNGPVIYYFSAARLPQLSSFGEVMGCAEMAFPLTAAAGVIPLSSLIYTQTLRTLPDTLLTVAPDSGVVATGDSATVQLALNAGGFGRGVFQRRLRILTNDPNAETTEVPIRITLGAPAVELSQDSLKATLLAGERMEMPFVVSNRGLGDLSFDITVRSAPASSNALLSANAPPKIGRILFDLGHTTLNTDFNLLRREWLALGYEVIDWLGTITPAALADFDMVCIAPPSFTISPQEISALQNFVANGGSLLLIAEGDRFLGIPATLAVNTLLQPYSMSIFGGFLSGVPIQVTDIRPHPVTEEVHTLNFAFYAGINTAGDAQILAVTPNGETCIAAAETGGGRVLLLSDSAPFSDDRFRRNDEPILARNAARWLTGIIDWLAVAPDTGTVAAGSSMELTATFNSNQLQPDSVYHAVVRVASTDFREVAVDLPVRLAVLDTCVAPTHFQFATTDAFYSIVIDSVIIDDDPLGFCDEIGVFDDDLCVGAVPYSGRFPLALSAWQDDPTTPAKDGFTPGNPISFVVWDRSAGADAEYPAVATYSLGDGNFSTGVFSRVSLLNSRSIISQQTALRTGWNWMSFFIALDSLAATRAFASLDSLNIVSSETGEFFIPGKASTLARVDLSKMYKAHLSAPDTLTTRGHPILTGTPIPVHQGWNWVAYYPALALEPAVALASLGENLVIAHNQYGEFFIPGVVNTMRRLSRGQGYKLYSNAPDTLIYPKSAVAKTPTTTPYVALSSAAHYRPVQDHGESFAIVIEAIRGVQRQLTEDDEIAVFAEDGTLLGTTRWQPSSVNVMAAWDDDPMTPAKDGYRSGDRMRFVLWDHSTATEIELMADFRKGDAIIGNAPYAQILLRTKDVPARFVLHPNFPNPFLSGAKSPAHGGGNPETHIRFDLPENGRVTLRIFNSLGQQVRVLVDGEYPTGYHRVVWDGKDGHGKAVASGVYFYRLKAGEFVAQRKMILLR